MFDFGQLKSQARQLLLFRNIIPLSRLLVDALFLPFEYLGHSGKAGFPWAINLLVTSRCNLHCEMCHFKASAIHSADSELSLDDIRIFIKDISKRKSHIFLSGGEPFLREDIFEIIGAINKSGLTWGICTNGTLLDENKIKELVGTEPSFMIFSLHGNKEIHDKITGIQGSFEKLYKNINTVSLTKIRTKIIINCTLTKSNLKRLKEVAEIAEELRVDALRFEHLNFLTMPEKARHLRVCGGDIKLSSYFGDAGDYGDYYNSVIKMQKIKDEFKIPISFKPYLRDAELKSWYSDIFNTNRKCFFIWRSLFIYPNGDITPCQFLIYKMGNIKTDSLESIWNSAQYSILRLKLRKGLLPGCARCCKL